MRLVWQRGHQANYCSAEPRCPNCSGAHSANYFRCDAYLFRCEIEAIMAREHITRMETTEKVRDTFTEEGKSYRFTVHKGTTTEEESTTGGITYPGKRTSEKNAISGCRRY